MLLLIKLHANSECVNVPAVDDICENLRITDQIYHWFYPPFCFRLQKAYTAMDGDIDACTYIFKQLRWVLFRAIFHCMHQSIFYMNRVYWYNMAILWLSHSCSVSKLSSDVRKHMVFMYVSMYIAQNSPLPLLTNLSFDL